MILYVTDESREREDNGERARGITKENKNVDVYAPGGNAVDMQEVKAKGRKRIKRKSVYSSEGRNESD